MGINTMHAESEIEELLELGFDPDEAETILCWHRTASKVEAQTAGGVAIVRLMEYIFGGNKGASLHIRAVGLLFAFDLEHLGGFTSLQHAADAIGCSQPALTMSAKTARRVLMA